MSSRFDSCKLGTIDLVEGDVCRKCVRDGWDKPIVIVPEDCDACKAFKNRYIEYPIEVSKITNYFDDTREDSRCGNLVKVKPVNEEKYGKVTYLGIYLGEMSIGAFISHNETNQELTVTPHRNPAIFVPELHKIIYGCESWWGFISSIEELREITNKGIENVWYVKALKDTLGGKKEE